MRPHDLATRAHGIFSPRCIHCSNTGTVYRKGQQNRETAAGEANDECVSTLTRPP